MPDHSEPWPVIEANDVLKGDLSMDALLKIRSQSDGLLIHYDIAFIHTHGLKRYEDDPATALLAGTGTLQVVFIRPNFQMLRKQFFNRKVRRQKTKSKASLLWKRFIRQPMRRAMSPFTGKHAFSTEDLYSEHKGLTHCYREWEAFLQRLAKERPNTEILIVEPASSQNKVEEFQLVKNQNNAVPTNTLRK